ncbi:ankyrin repeat domain-containing protein [Agromyces cavernae]|uniref:ankyrin repeat domain-containing protein n=1 Tax=Agromyces cavernae TaxID=2898659 RepID=UPI00355752DE
MSRSALHYAAAEADDEAVARSLDHGADPNAADANGWTPLHFAAQSHSLSSIHLLLDAGALIDAQDRHGYGVASSYAGFGSAPQSKG